MLPVAIRCQLFYGPYQAPPFRIGDIVEDEIRGGVKIVGENAGRIRWPLAANWTRKSLVIYGDLAKAIRLESAQAVAYWFGTNIERVRLLRRALGVPISNEGTTELRRLYGTTPTYRRMLRKAWANAGDQKRRERNRCAQLARNREKSRRDSSQRRAESRKPEKSAQSFRRWSVQELSLLEKRPVPEVSERTGRTRQAVYHRRRRLETTH